MYRRLLYGAEDPSIAGMVLDSPFSDLVELMMELVDTYKIRLPKFTVKFAIQYMRKAIQKKAKFDIENLNTIKTPFALKEPTTGISCSLLRFQTSTGSVRFNNAYRGKHLRTFPIRLPQFTSTTSLTDFSRKLSRFPTSTGAVRFNDAYRGNVL
ncbi:hypothetical protein LWI28_013204 [Acer negundo]|uniref:Uncharacterized protein n=1 Tax=Acer negundo TaxID=4023 RepID=A0AAD5P0D2_ACENE|nr:hypothetical protein LWI28_013204 [Acer negundo]